MQRRRAVVGYRGLTCQALARTASLELMKHALLTVLLASGLVGGFPAQTASAQDARDWPSTTRQDVEAAYQLLHDNHPGALPAFGDADFRMRLERARDQALIQADYVTTTGGHRAVLSAFALGLGDAHLRFQPNTNAVWRWSEILFRRDADAWRVAAHVRDADEIDLSGSELLDCEGRPAEEIAREWLGGYKADWSVEAEQRLKGLFLLLNDDNPFLTEPATCRFQVGDTVVEHAMEWQEASVDALQAAVDSVITYRAAGMGVRTFAGGGWIALGSLGDGAPAVVEEVRARAAELRSYPVVVLDMRGNGGGASSLGIDIAEALMGGVFVSSQVGNSGPCDAVWRATPGNLEAVRGWRRNDRGPEFNAWVDQTVSDLEAALAEGRETDKPVPTCPAYVPDPTAAAGSPSLFAGRLVLITDEVCFSSCLLVTDAFRKLGALHMGHETQRATRYTEVRSQALPSGLGSFTTMQRAMIGEVFVGPFAPDVVHPGPMLDDARLEAWVMAMLNADRA